MDFSPFFEKYEKLVLMADGVFEKVKYDFGENVKCNLKCSDCCHALFDLTLIEAVYINKRFNEKHDGMERLDLIEKANRADRKICKIKRDAQKEYLNGKGDIEILGRMAAERVRCPLLSESEECLLYEYRPITCRLYGIPTSTSGMSHTCGLSGFVEGKQYPAVNMDIIHKRLYDISEELVLATKTRFIKMSEMLVPLSMALLTDYNDDLFGRKALDKNEDDVNA